MKAPIATGCALLAALVHAQEAPPVFRATAELVLLDVQVVHNKTKTASGALQPGDFQLFEDVPNDPELKKLWQDVARNVTLESSPNGAKVGVRT